MSGPVTASSGGRGRSGCRGTGQREKIEQRSWDRDMGYTAAVWLGFGEALAAVAGALTGLLFVAVSIKSDLLALSPSLASRAAQTLVLFMIPRGGAGPRATGWPATSSSTLPT